LDIPVLDLTDFFEKIFNEKEVDFYKTIFSKNVKGEVAHKKGCSQKLKNGLQRREEINQELKKSSVKSGEPSDAVINTQRAGLMARMFELG